MDIENYGPFQGDHHVELPQGLAGITGPNGYGKSALIAAIDICLYGKEERVSWGEYVSDGCDSMMLCLTFEHRGELFRVRRSVERGRAFCDLERWEDECRP